MSFHFLLAPDAFQYGSSLYHVRRTSDILLKISNWILTVLFISFPKYVASNSCVKGVPSSKWMEPLLFMAIATHLPLLSPKPYPLDTCSVRRNNSFIYIYVYVCIIIYNIYICINNYIYICIHNYVYIYICICIYNGIYIYNYIYIIKNIYICLCKEILYHIYLTLPDW